jgi:acyl-coenzyme A synthetase/AMP-(fatty) acid ligase
VVFEGVPSYPTPARLFEVVDKYAVTHLYTAPTAIRAFMGVSARVSEEASYILFCKKKRRCLIDL